LNIPRPLKLVLLAFTLWIPVYMAGFFAMIWTRSMFDFDLLFKVHLATMGISAVTLVTYIVHLFKTQHVRGDMKALWGVTLFCAAPLAMPIYWWKHVWPDEGPSRWAIDSVVPPSA